MNVRFVVDALAEITHIADQPQDNEEEALQKSLMVSGSIMFILAGLGWGTIYLMVGEFVAASIPFGYGIFSMISLFAFGMTGRFKMYRISQFLLILLCPFLMAQALGGFFQSSAVILWSVICPFGALLFSSLRRAYFWQVGFLVLLVLSGFLDPLINIHTSLKSSLITFMFVLNIGVISTMAFVLIYYFIHKKNEAMELVQVEREKSERLLLNVLPKEVAPTLRDGKSTIADKCDCASVLFADMAGFTQLSTLMTPEESVDMLNEIFSYFDILASKYGVEKIRTIGDNYMVASGVPAQRVDHARVLAEMALEMRDYIETFPEWAGRKITFRFGIHCGPLVAGVIGRQKFHYDVWGDTVNVASRMESEGVPGRIQITRQMQDELGDDFIFELRGIIEVKGKGSMETWFLEGKRQ